MEVIFLAFGTLGDVLPIAFLAEGLSFAHPSFKIYFVTHLAHESNIKPQLTLNRIGFTAVSSPPFISQNDLKTKKSREAERNNEHEESYGESWESIDGVKHRQECKTIVESIITKIETNSSTLIGFNLFALEGFHLSEYFQTKCVFLSPNVLPYRPPQSFEKYFKMSFPSLYRKLKNAKNDELNWNDIEHYLWPIFSRKWKYWRQNTLFLSPFPFIDPVTSLPIEYNWPKSPKLLYGFSSQIVERPSHWPLSAIVCGFWFPSERSSFCSFKILTNSEKFNFQNSSNAQDLESKANLSAETPPLWKPSKKIKNFMDNAKMDQQEIVFVGFSTVGKMGFLTRPVYIIQILDQVFKKLKKKCIFLTSNFLQLENAILNFHFGHFQMLKRESKSKSKSTSILNSTDNVFSFSETCTTPNLDLKVSAIHETRLDSDSSQIPLSNSRLDPDLCQVQERSSRHDEFPKSRKILKSIEKQNSDSVVSFENEFEKTFETWSVGFDSPSNANFIFPSEGLIVGDGNILCVKEFIPHEWLFSNCDVAFHHGGSGTTSFALKAGIPQIICPFFHDQFYWAEKLFWLGVSSPPLEQKYLMQGNNIILSDHPQEQITLCASNISNSILFALKEDVKSMAKSWSDTLNKEDGIAVAIREIEKIIE